MWKSKPSWNDLNKMQRYLREYCSNYFIKGWKTRNAFISTCNMATCEKSTPILVTPTLQIDDILLYAKGLDYKVVDVEVGIDGLMGTATLARIMEGEVKYGTIFLEYARAYWDMKGYTK